MRLSIATNITIEFFGEEKGLEMLKQAGFDTIDYSLYQPFAIEMLLKDDYMFKARRTKELLDKYGLLCNQAHASFKFALGMEMNENCPEYLTICRGIEYAGYLGAKCIVIHPVKNKDFSEEQFIDFNIKYIKTLQPFAQKYGIKIAVENMSGSFDRINKIVSALSSEDFIMCLDTGHAQITGLEVSEFIKCLLPQRLGALHVHDNNGVNDQHTLPYLGICDWDKTIDALIEYGYQGDFTMEAGKFLRAFSPDLLPEALKFYYAVCKSLVDKYQTKLDKKEQK